MTWRKTVTSKITASSKRCRTSIPERVARAKALLCPLRSHAVALSPTGLLCPRPAHYFLYLLSFHSARVPHVLGPFSSPEISLVSVLFRSMVSCIKLRALDAERKKNVRSRESKSVRCFTFLALCGTVGIFLALV